MRFSDRLAGIIAIAALLVTGHASATPNFPDAVARHLTLEASPQCSLCHVGTPARGTVNTPFGSTMRKRGLVAYDEGALATALDALGAENKDSDGDGTSDIRELHDGTDPNGAPGADVDLTPDYGCASSSGSGSGGGVALVIALLVALRRRTRHQ